MLAEGIARCDRLLVLLKVVKALPYLVDALVIALFVILGIDQKAMACVYVIYFLEIHALVI